MPEKNLRGLGQSAPITNYRVADSAKKNDVLIIRLTEKLKAIRFMKFFLPLAGSEEQAERVYSRIANRLKEMGYNLTSHRISKVTYRREGKLVTDVVGEDCEIGEIVLAIFKNDVGYFICTYSQGAVWGEPVTARYSTVESAESFDGEKIDEKNPG